MSIKLAYQAYKTLDPDQQSFLKEKLLEGSRTPADWLEYLKRLSDFDRAGDAARATAGKTAIILGVALVGGTYLLVFLPGSAPLWPVVLTMILAGLLAIAFAILYVRLRRVDLPNRLRQFIVPIIAILREDMEPAQQLNLRLDLRGPMGEKETSCKDDSDSYPKVKETHYADSWFSGGANLADGSTLQWQMIDYIRERVIKKRNPRGRIKTKTKYKIQALMDVRLGLRSKDYAPVEAQPNSDVSIKPGEKRNQLRIRRMEETTDLHRVMDFNLFLNAVTEAYKQVKRQEA